MAHATGIEYATRRFEPQTTALVQRLLPSGGVFIDVGANLGYYTRLAAECVGPHGCVVACEPSPENVVALRHNSEHFPHVQIVPSALAAKQELLPLYLSSHSSCHSLVDSTYFKDGSFIWVPAISFDQLCVSLKLERIDLVKVGVEGAEALVLAGMAQTIAERRITNLIIEFCPANIEDAGYDCLALAQELLTAFDRIQIIDAPLAALQGQLLTDQSSFTALIPQIKALELRGYLNLLCQTSPSAS
jgi:FkbM family methyltransferase